MGKTKPSLSRRKGVVSKSKDRALALARLEKTRQKWVNVLQGSQSVSRRPSRIECKQTRTVHVSEATPSTSQCSATSSSEKKLKVFEDRKLKVPASNGCVKKDSVIDEKKVDIPVTHKEQLPTALCDLNEIANLFAACSCPECGRETLELETDSSKTKGMAVFLKVWCSGCKVVIASNFTSATMPSGVMELNRKSVTASLLSGFGQRKFNKFCEYLDLPGLNAKTFSDNAQAIFKLTPDVKDKLLKMAVQAVREAHAPMNPGMTEDTVINIAVSYDGTWHTRGHSSKVGVVCAIDLLTGICIDYHVLSKYCQKCQTTGKRFF